MDHSASNQTQPLARKVKKKHGKDEFDRLKQAEKKKRRLEKALATSAAIRAELEKKKLKKLEEQQRLDEEGAAIAEAVALHVLLGEDSSHDTAETTNYLPHRTCASYVFQEIGSVSNGYGLGDTNLSVPFTTDVWDNSMGLSADLIAAQAVSSLQISDTAGRNAFNGMFQGWG